MSWCKKKEKVNANNPRIAKVRFKIGNLVDNREVPKPKYRKEAGSRKMGRRRRRRGEEVGGDVEARYFTCNL